MDANARRIMGLISEMNVRFEVPVYQRPYSWGEAQCAQLWDDILAAGRRRTVPHFTGSIVTIQDGTLSDQGVARLLLIDGQQRITTIMLLLVALARHAARTGDEGLPYSWREVVQGGYLTNRYRTGADHFKLTLSKGDQAAYQALIEAVEAGETGALPAVLEGGTPLADNLALFERRVAALADVGSVWAGLMRLEVVSVALSQGSDDPQVIFESMNSTGKDLSSADLVRNFVLMGYPVAEQRALYQTYWRPLEDVVASAGEPYDEAFDSFLRCYLSLHAAPEPFTDAEAYPAFKRHVLARGYAQADRMKVFAARLRRFAGYHAQATGAAVQGDEELTVALARLRWLAGGRAAPLVMELLDAHERKALDHEGLLDVLATLEAYLVRRAACDCAGSALAGFLPSLVARASAARAEGADVRQVLVAAILNEEGTARRMPDDAEFARALATRDMRDLWAAPYVLARLGEAAGDALGAGGLPANGAQVRRLAGEGRRDVGPEADALGNLVLAAGGAVTGGADAIPDEVEISARTERLAQVALALWPLPTLPEEARAAYRAHGRAATATPRTLADLFKAGLLQMDDVLVSADQRYVGRATVTSTGKVMLANGEMFDDPTAAYERFLGLVGAASGGLNGWLYWRRGEGGPTLDELRARL